MRPLIIVQWVAIGILLLYSVAATLAFEQYYQPTLTRTAPITGQSYDCTYRYEPLSGKVAGVTCK